MRRSATGTVLVAAFPGVETPGYHQASLREEQHWRFAAERRLMVARPFKAGIETPTNHFVAERQLMRHHRKHAPESFMCRSATQTLLVAAFPGVETPGYHRVSLREKRPMGFAGERHLMVARPFNTGIELVVRIVPTTPSLPFRVSKTQHDGAEHSNVSFRTHSFSQTVRAVTSCDLGFRETCGFVVH